MQAKTNGGEMRLKRYRVDATDPREHYEVGDFTDRDDMGLEHANVKMMECHLGGYVEYDDAAAEIKRLRGLLADAVEIATKAMDEQMATKKYWTEKDESMIARLAAIRAELDHIVDANKKGET